MATRFKLQQTSYGFRMYDTQNMESVEGSELYSINLQEAEWFEQGGTVEIVDGEAIVKEPVVEGEVL